VILTSPAADFTGRVSGDCRPDDSSLRVCRSRRWLGNFAAGHSLEWNRTMPTKFKSPYTTSFCNAIKKGTSFTEAVYTIANRYNKKASVVWQSLWKAGVVNRQKFNGQWVYWPTQWQRNWGKQSSAKDCQTKCWQWFVDCCFQNGFCTPNTVWNNTGTQNEFMNFFKKYFVKQFSGSFVGVNSKSTSRPRPSFGRSTRRTTTGTKSYGRKTTKARKNSSKRYGNTGRSYKFASNSRRYSYAA
jgi:hypothetical protein